MKIVHHLTPWRLLAGITSAIVIGEIASHLIAEQFHLRNPVVSVGAVSAGIVLTLVAWQYDGRDDA